MLVITLLISGTVLFVAIAPLFTFQVLSFRSNFERDTATLAAVIANNSTAAVIYKDAKTGSELISSLQAEPAVVTACLASLDGSVFARFGQAENTENLSRFPPPGKFAFTGRQALYTQSIELEKKRVGTLYLRLDYWQTFVELLHLYGLVILGVMLASVSLAVLLSGRLQRIITDPVLDLARAAQAVGEHKDYSLRVRANERGDELGQLTRSFNEMLGRIQTQNQDLKESRDRFEVLVNSVDGIVWESGADLRFTFVSRQSERILGYTPEQWLANPNFWREHLHPNDAARALKSYRDCAAREKPYSHEYRMIAADGRAVWICESVVVQLGKDGQSLLARGIFQDITQQKLAAEELAKLNRQLVDTSRQAGMAEVATGVLHNVGNVLNSVNVSCTLLLDAARRSEVANLPKVAAMLEAQKGRLAEFLSQDPKGKLIPVYLCSLAPLLMEEQASTLKELSGLRDKIDHIKEIVAMQQSYATVSGVIQTLAITELVEDAIKLNTGALTRHGVQVERQFKEVPPVATDKHKVLQILLNLIRNAKYACDEGGVEPKVITLRVHCPGPERVRVQVVDNGVGIPPENLTRIFFHGFTTRKGGHGFGLHSGANAAKEIGGVLTAHSDGPGKGAVFTLELPLHNQRVVE